MSEGKLISIKQFKAYTRLDPKTVDRDIKRKIIKTEKNKAGGQSIRWFSVVKNLTQYRKDREKWEKESQYSSTTEEKKLKKKEVKTKIVKEHDMLKISRWCREAGVNSPQVLTNAIAEDNLFELTNIRIRNLSVTGTKRRHFEMEWLGPEKGAIIVDVLYMNKNVPLDFKKQYLKEKLNDQEDEKPIEPIEEVDENVAEDALKVLFEPKHDLVEALAQFLFDVKKRYDELITEDKGAENVKLEAEAK